MIRFAYISSKTVNSTAFLFQTRSLINSQLLLKSLELRIEKTYIVLINILSNLLSFPWLIYYDNYYYKISLLNYLHVKIRAPKFPSLDLAKSWQSRKQYWDLGHRPCSKSGAGLAHTKFNYTIVERTKRAAHRIVPFLARSTALQLPVLSLWSSNHTNLIAKWLNAINSPVRHTLTKT